MAGEARGLLRHKDTTLLQIVSAAIQVGFDMGHNYVRKYGPLVEE